MKRARTKKLSAWMILFIQLEDRLETWLAGLLLHPYIRRINKTGDDYFSSHRRNSSSPAPAGQTRSGDMFSAFRMLFLLFVWDLKIGVCLNLVRRWGLELKIFTPISALPPLPLMHGRCRPHGEVGVHPMAVKAATA
jgi:hypothetical protein